MVIVSENDFIGLIREAIERNQSVDFSGKEVLLSAPVRIQRKDCLHIIGGTIRGSDYTHSLFILNSRKELPEGARCLHLEGTTLHHCAVSEDVRDIGAAIFAMGKATVVVVGCTLTSTGGFPLWLKHSAAAEVRDTTLSGGRTGAACFNAARINLTDCLLCDVSIHGICLRGTAVARLVRCRLHRCLQKAIYFYDQASVTHDGLLQITDCPLGVVDGRETATATDGHGV